MPTEQTKAQSTEAPKAVAPPLTVKELAALLVKHYGLTEGRFDILIEFQIGVGSIGPSPEARLPGVMVGLSKVGLTRAKDTDSPTTVDAASINTAPEPRRRMPSAGGGKK